MIRSKYIAGDSHNLNTRMHFVSEDEHVMSSSHPVNSEAEVGDHNAALVSSYGSHPDSSFTDSSG